MAAEVLSLVPALPPPGPAPRTADETYWRTFKNQVLFPSPHNAAITSITGSGTNPLGNQADTFAITSGSRVQIYNVKTRKLVKTISRFGVDDTARSGVLRRDGRILLAGGDSGIIQAFDTGSRAILRQWRGEHAHKLPVHLVRWSPSVLTDLMSCSDDRTVRLWDLTEDAAKWTGIGHEDYVRSGAFLPGQGGNMVVSGSYDQTVRVWDTRQNQTKCALAFKFGAPIEDVLSLSSVTLAAAAGNEISVINLVSGRVEQCIRAHQKTVTSICTAQRGTRILTAALDGHVKVHNASTWEVVAGFKYPAPILSLAVVPTPGNNNNTEPDDRHLAVGLQSGLLSLRTRLPGGEKAKQREREKKMQALIAGEGDAYDRKQKKKDMRQGIRARDRGKDYRGEGADIVIVDDRQRRKVLRKWQRSLREGRYAQALDEVLPPGNWREAFNKEDFLTLLTALRHRSALRTALAHRSEDRLIPLLDITFRYVAYPEHLGLLSEALAVLLDLYSHRLDDWQHEDGDGKEVASLVAKIGRRVRQATDWAQQAHSTLGMIEMLEFG